MAQTAGVSVGTVSNVLNRPALVSPATRERVLSVIEELNFVRNASARQLREGKVRTVGAVVLDIANPFFTEMARGIEDRLATEDFTLMLSSSDGDPEREGRYLRLFEEQGVHGVLVSPSRGTRGNIDKLRRHGVPVVLLDYRSQAGDVSSVSVDDVAGGTLAVRHLLERGHRRIAFLNGPLSIQQCVDRRDGAVAAFQSAGLDPADGLLEIPMPALNAAAGDVAMEGLLDLDEASRPTAVFCVNDLTALGAMRCARRAGLSIPEDMAFVGYDDIQYSAELMTPLTSVRQAMHRMGWTAADLLLRSEDGPEQVVFEPELIVRESSGPVRERPTRSP
ncbi:LacI family DNA-binding transcriptional regulator [Georgenia sp. AZ-5]|uniref:LacI family DNA-binding transcriptional regulator n=1 Tax=Georgenia sp. AZ-5 TaxID=3367526 RepID=UPI00375510DD